MEVRNVPNQAVVTAFPIRETIREWKPGAYFVVVWNAAKPPSRDYDDDETTGGGAAGLWVIDTDIGLTSFSGDDGLNVFARSLQTAQPMPGIEVTVLSRGNEPIGKVVTGTDGRASFAAGLLKGTGAAEAVAVMAQDPAKKDFARLELTKSAFDLSDRGIDGRPQPGPVDAFSLHRARRLSPRRNHPSDGVVARRLGQRAVQSARHANREAARRQRVHPLHPCAAGIRRRLPVDRPAEILPARPLVRGGAHRPQRRLRRPCRILSRGFRAGEAQGRADLRTADPQAGNREPLRDLGRLPLWRTRLRPRRRGRHADHRGRCTLPRLRQVQVRFRGGAREIRAALHRIEGREHRQGGKSSLLWAGDLAKDTVLPLRAQVQARVFEPGGGRATKTDKILPVRTRDTYLGIAPTFEGRYSREGVDTEFDIVAVDAGGAQVARPAVEYRIERIVYAYQWFQVDGRWRWQSVTNTRLVTADKVTLKADAPTRLSQRLEWASTSSRSSTTRRTRPPV